jgi:hypothetical protein
VAKNSFLHVQTRTRFQKANSESHQHLTLDLADKISSQSHLTFLAPPILAAIYHSIIEAENKFIELGPALQIRSSSFDED